jgi:hypothetical protein
MGQRDWDAGEDALTVDDGGDDVDRSEAQNQPISVPTFVTAVTDTVQILV